MKIDSTGLVSYYKPVFNLYLELKSETKADAWKNKVANYITELLEKMKQVEEQYLKKKQITKG